MNLFDFLYSYLCSDHDLGFMRANSTRVKVSRPGRQGEVITNNHKYLCNFTDFVWIFIVHIIFCLMQDLNQQPQALAYV